MPPTSPVTERARAFTLVEMIVVCAVLVVIAAALVPNLLAFTRSRSLKDLEANVARLPAEARNEALKSQTPIRLRVSGTTLVMEQVPADGSNPQQVKSVTSATAFRWILFSSTASRPTSAPGRGRSTRMAARTAAASSSRRGRPGRR